MKVGGRQELWLAVGVIEWLWPVTVQLMPSEEGAGVLSLHGFARENGPVLVLII